MNDYKKHLEIRVELAKERLQGQAETLKRSMEILLLRLEKDNLKSINSLGEVQGLGTQIDVACMELRTLMHVLEELEAFEKLESK